MPYTIDVKDWNQGDSGNDILKKILRALLAPLVGTGAFSVRQAASTSTTAASLSGTTKTVTSAGTPEALVGTSTLVDSVVIAPLRTNTNRVYVGFSSTNDTQCMIAPVGFSAPAGKKIDLSQIYIDVTTNGEGVRYATID